MATSDMSLGGGAGFGAGYTPIRFAPLVSLTGPVMASATPAAPEAAAPMLRPPMMADQGGGYETPQRTDAAFQNLQPIGYRLETPEGRAAELQNLGRAMTALMSPMTTIPSLALTGKTPMELMAQAMGMGGAQSAQGTPAAPFGGFLQGLQNLRDSFARNVFGQEEVPLFETRAPIESRGPTTIVGGNGQYIVTPDLAPIDQTNALFNDPAFYNAIVAGVPVGQMQQSNMAPILDALNQSILQGTSTMEQFGPQFTGGQPNESSSYGSDFGGGNVADNSGISYDISDFR